MQERHNIFLILTWFALLMTTGCDDTKMKETLSTGPSHIVAEIDNGCPFQCAWGPSHCIDSMKGIVVGGTCAVGQLCCDVGQPPQPACSGVCVGTWENCPGQTEKGAGSCYDALAMCCVPLAADTESDTGVDTSILPSVCPWQCTWDAWNCENGELGTNGIPMPNIPCPYNQIAMGRTFCCNTSGSVDTEVVDTDVTDTQTIDTDIPDTQIVDTEIPDTQTIDTEIPDTQIIDTGVVDSETTDTSAPETCPWQCTWDAWNCENGELGSNGISMPTIPCSATQIAMGRTFCCNTSGSMDTEEADTETADTADSDTSTPVSCPWQCTWDAWNCENGELGSNGIPMPNIPCSPAQIAKGRTFCCNTSK